MSFVGDIAEMEVGKPPALAVALGELMADAEAVRRHVRWLARRLKRLPPDRPAAVRGTRGKS